MNQSGPNTGEDEGGTVRLVDDGFEYPETASVISVTITPLEGMIDDGMADDDGMEGEDDSGDGGTEDGGAGDSSSDS